MVWIYSHILCGPWVPAGSLKWGLCTRFWSKAQIQWVGERTTGWLTDRVLCPALVWASLTLPGILGGLQNVDPVGESQVLGMFTLPALLFAAMYMPLKLGNKYHLISTSLITCSLSSRNTFLNILCSEKNALSMHHSLFRISMPICLLTAIWMILCGKVDKTDSL